MVASSFQLPKQLVPNQELSSNCHFSIAIPCEAALTLEAVVHLLFQYMLDLAQSGYPLFISFLLIFSCLSFFLPSILLCMYVCKKMCVRV